MPNDTQPTEERLKQAVKESLQILYKIERDKYLIDQKVHERSIVFRFGVYFQQIANENHWFQDYNIDCEYNKNMGDSKRTPHWPKGTYPDFIIHKRGENSTRAEPCNNLLILEFKTHDSKNGDDKRSPEEKCTRIENRCDRRDAVVDCLKIWDFMLTDAEYQYRYGASIIIGKDIPVWCWMDGEAFRREDSSVNELPRVVHQCAQPPYLHCSHSGRGRIVCPIYKPVWE